MRKSKAVSDSRIVILGVGNTLCRDEGVGVRVIEALRDRYSFPPSVDLVDGGTAGLVLLGLIEGVDHLIVVDAVQAGDEPGSVFIFTLDQVPMLEAPQLLLRNAGTTCPAHASGISPTI